MLLMEKVQQTPALALVLALLVCATERGLCANQSLVTRAAVTTGVYLEGEPGTVYAIGCPANPHQTSNCKWLTNVALPSSSYVWPCPDALAAQATPIRVTSLSASVPTNPAPEVWTWIPPGRFVMGSPEGESGRNTNEGPQTTVVLTRGFFMSKKLVTQAEYFELMSNNPSAFALGGDYPVEEVTWANAAACCQLAAKRDQPLGKVPLGWVYRLPTEAEWEYACRAGTTNRFSFGDDLQGKLYPNYAWGSANSGNATHPAGTKNPNSWQLYDMHGNVRQWCLDDGCAYPGEGIIDPVWPDSAVGHVARGGCWADAPTNGRSAARFFYASTQETNSRTGFRMVLAPEDSAMPLTTNWIYVQKSGSDASGRRNDPSQPFLTAAAALAVALPGDTIDIGPGNFNETLIVKPRINYYLEADCVVSDVNVVQNICSLAGGMNIAPFQYIWGEGSIISPNSHGVNGFPYSLNLSVKVKQIASLAGYLAAVCYGYSHWRIEAQDPLTNSVEGVWDYGAGSLHVKCASIRTGILVVGNGNAQIEGDINGGMYNGYLQPIASGPGVFTEFGARVQGSGNVWAGTDAISLRTNCSLLWIGNLTSATDSGLFMQHNSRATVYGNVADGSWTGFWQLAGSGCGVFNGASTNYATIYGNVSGLMPLITEHGRTEVFGNVSYLNPYNAPLRYWSYLVEPIYTNALFLPPDIQNRYESAVSMLGHGTNIIHGNVSSPRYAIWDSGTGTVAISGATTGAITNVSGSIVSFVETNEAIVALPPLTAETRPQFFETAVLPHAILDISGPVGSNCVIAAAQTLSSGAVWETRASLALTNGTARWIDTNGTGASQYYYKISLAKP